MGASFPIINFAMPILALWAGINLGSNQPNYIPLQQCPDFILSRIDGAYQEHFIGLSKTMNDCMNLVSSQGKTDFVSWDRDARKCYYVSTPDGQEPKTFLDKRYPALCKLDQPYPRPDYILRDSINVAILGRSGVGKSTFLNSIRRMHPTEPGAAKPGIAETTIEPKDYLYSFHGVPFVLYDLPGAGTSRFPIDTYAARFGLRYFDMVILVTADRYTNDDIILAGELKRFNVPVYFVRTKTDLAIVENYNDDNYTPAYTRSFLKTMYKRDYGIDIYLSAKYKIDDPYEKCYDHIALFAELVNNIAENRGLGAFRELYNMIYSAMTNTFGGNIGGCELSDDHKIEVDNET